MNAFEVHFFIFSLRFVWLEDTQRRPFLILCCEFFYFILMIELGHNVVEKREHEIRKVWVYILFPLFSP